MEKKFCRSIAEKYWEREFSFQIDSTMWEKIYLRNCVYFFDKRLGAFKYKLLHNQLICKDKLFKWKIEQTDKCIHCGLVDNSKHQLYACEKVRPIWTLIGNILNINLQWKHLVLGFNEESERCKDINRICTIILYALYLYKFKEK